MPGSDGLGFLVILNKSSELRFELRRSELIFRTWVRLVQFVDCGVRACVGWVNELRADDGRTVSIEKLCVSLSPRVEYLNLKKVIKNVPELRESSVFRVFRIPMRVNILCIINFFTYSNLGPILVNILHKNIITGQEQWVFY